jgi:phenylalanyl-tRNA synthetase beta chain
MTAKKLGLPTEASFRFEREVDPEGLVRAADLAASLMTQLAGGKVAPGIIDENFLEGDSGKIELKTEKVVSRLGVSVSDDEVADCMKRLFADVKKSNPGVLIVCPPSFRRDLTRPVDLIEEVGRLIGFSEIPVTLPVCDMDYRPVSALLKSEDSIRDFLVGTGYFEVINYSFINEKWLDDLLIPDNDALRNVVKLLNPISEDMSVLRTFLLPSLLEDTKNNFNYKMQDIKIFEVRRVYNSLEKTSSPEEKHHVAGLVMGNNPFVYDFRPQPFDFLDIKGDVEGICELFPVSEARFIRPESVPSYFHPGICAEIWMGKDVAGVLGKLNPVVADSLKLPENIYYFELDIEKILCHVTPLQGIEEISKFPEIERDLAVVVDVSKPMGEIFEKIYKFQNKYLKEVELFDIYEGKEIEKGKKSVAFRLTYQAAKKTLKDKDVDKIHGQLASYLLKEEDIQLR